MGKSLRSPLYGRGHGLILHRGLPLCQAISRLYIVVHLFVLWCMCTTWCYRRFVAHMRTLNEIVLVDASGVVTSEPPNVPLNAACAWNNTLYTIRI